MRVYECVSVCMKTENGGEKEGEKQRNSERGNT